MARTPGRSPAVDREPADPPVRHGRRQSHRFLLWVSGTHTGGLELPGEVAGLVALDELVIHGWDIARARGQAYACDPGSLDAVHDFVAQFSGPEQEAARAGLFGPVVEVPEDAALLERVIGLAGRDPAWSPN